jgi:hypothetical protein
VPATSTMTVIGRRSAAEMGFIGTLDHGIAEGF